MNEFNYNLKPNKRSIGHRKLVYGIGINDANYQIRQEVNGKRAMCSFYRKWESMLMRCYDNKYQVKKPTYIGCIVCNEWHTFSNFKSWMIEQDWQGKHLDKDILILGNKTYSPETCLFVSPEINSLLTCSEASRGKLPQGVFFDKGNKKYIAQINTYGKKRYIGAYCSAVEAEKAYWEIKVKHVISVAMQQKSDILKNALIKWAKYKRTVFLYE